MKVKHEVTSNRNETSTIRRMCGYNMKEIVGIIAFGDAT